MGRCHGIPTHMTRFHIPPTSMCFSMLPTSQGRAHDTCVWSCLVIVRVSQHGVCGGDLAMSTISSTYRKALTQLWSSGVADRTCPRWGTRCGRTGSALDVRTVSVDRVCWEGQFGMQASSAVFPRDPGSVDPAYVSTPVLSVGARWGLSSLLICCRTPVLSVGARWGLSSLLICYRTPVLLVGARWGLSSLLICCCTPMLSVGSQFFIVGWGTESVPCIFVCEVAAGKPQGYITCVDSTSRCRKLGPVRAVTSSTRRYSGHTWRSSSIQLEFIWTLFLFFVEI